jgi:hypothetical protein
VNELRGLEQIESGRQLLTVLLSTNLTGQDSAELIRTEPFHASSRRRTQTQNAERRSRYELGAAAQCRCTFAIVSDLRNLGAEDLDFSWFSTVLFPTSPTDWQSFERERLLSHRWASASPFDSIRRPATGTPWTLPYLAKPVKIIKVQGLGALLPTIASSIARATLRGLS